MPEARRLLPSLLTATGRSWRTRSASLSAPSAYESPFGDDEFEESVQQVRSTAAAAVANQDVPLKRVVSALPRGSRDTPQNPLVRLIFALHSQYDLGGIQLEVEVDEPVPTANDSNRCRGPPVPGGREAEWQHAFCAGLVRARSRSEPGRCP